MAAKQYPDYELIKSGQRQTFQSRLYSLWLVMIISDKTANLCDIRDYETSPAFLRHQLLPTKLQYV